MASSVRIRPAAVAGSFYPSDAAVLRDTIADLLGRAGERETRAVAAPLSAPKMLVVPHAGYVYSGAVAASAYRLLAGVRDRVRRVVLLGPAHRVALWGLALPSVDSFWTPFGAVPIDRAAIERVLALPHVVVSDAAHAWEHALEVQLPFLQATLAQFTLVPFVVGDVSPREVAAVLEALWGGEETLVVISSDLSHYHEYAVARAVDGHTVDAMLALDARIDHDQACGATPVNGALLCASRHGLVPRLLDLRNSGDTAGSRDRVVGYAAIAFEPGADARA